MKRSLITVAIGYFLLCGSYEFAQAQSNETTVKIFRLFGKELLDSNAIPFMQPLVTSINATSNARFFNQAFVPKKVDKPYYRFGIHSMVGFVRDDQRTYKPRLPISPSPNGALQYFNPFTGTISDTAALVNELLKYVLYQGQQQGQIPVPTDAATVFGKLDRSIPLDPVVLLGIVENEAIFKQLSPALQETVRNAFKGIPTTRFTLPPGQDMNYLVAAVPQFEIGSLWGTELLVRFIPPLELDTNVGKFAFWGIGLKHSITQYFEEPPFDAAIQAVYQGTDLENKIGVTGASLKATGNIFNVNLHASKHFEGIVDIFTGFSYENLEIDAKYTYVLPEEVQAAIRETNPGFVDNEPQTSNPIFKDVNYKWVIGLSRQFGPIAIFADYSVSKFNIFSGGIEARF